MTNINTIMNCRESEFPRKTSATKGFDEYSCSDNNRISQKNSKQRSTMARGSILNDHREEFARATMDSSSTNRDSNYESDSEPNDLINNKNE